MATITQLSAGSTAITITLAGLTSGNARQSLAVDNSSTNYLDALVSVGIKLAAGGPGAAQIIYVYAYGSEDGTNFSDNATGADAAISLRNPTNCILIGSIATPDSGALTYQGPPMSVASAFGGKMPRKWGIVVENQTGLTFDSTEGNLRKSFTGLTLSVA